MHQVVSRHTSEFLLTATISELCMHRFTSPTVSVIIELDNATLVDFSVWSQKLLTMLQWLRKGPTVNIVDVIIVHNQQQKDMLERFVETLNNEDRSVIKTSGMDTANASYYKMKNAGALVAQGELLVFLDSDLEPVSGSFNDLVQPLFDHNEVAVSGYASFPVESFISRAYSLFWIFPIFNRSETMGKYQLVANSCAFRRDWFLQKPFQTNLGGLRTACKLMSMRLKQEGRTLHHPNVWFHHELWNDSWRFFVWRALVMGRDADKKQAYEFSPLKVTRISKAFKSIFFDIGRLIKRHLRYYKSVELPLWQVPFSFLMGAAFWLIVRSSQMVSASKSLNNQLEKTPAEFTS
jgi:hypothetical protein